MTTSTTGGLKKVVLPFWVLGDESTSMLSNGGLALLNKALTKIYENLRDHPAISDVARIAIVAFAGSAETIVELSNLNEVTQIPSLVARPDGTNYAAAFKHLRSVIERDVATLVADNYSVHRPAVFFCSDGEPNGGGDWRAAHAKLVDPNWPIHPNIIAFGFNGADESVIKEVGTLAAYMADPGTDVAMAISEFASALMRTILATAEAGAMATPAQVPGFHLAGASIVA